MSDQSRWSITKCFLVIHGTANCSTRIAAPAQVHRWFPETTAQMDRDTFALFVCEKFVKGLYFHGPVLLPGAGLRSRCRSGMYFVIWWPMCRYILMVIMVKYKEQLGCVHISLKWLKSDLFFITNLDLLLWGGRVANCANLISFRLDLNHIRVWGLWSDTYMINSHVTWIRIGREDSQDRWPGEKEKL